MYVQCERCKTEYDFDDALVSERGTTVKCTNCAHQFRVKRASGGSELDRWAVTTQAGQKLIFTSLKELQRAIIARLVGREDTLARGNAPPRVLGAIAELEPFFDSAEPNKSESPALQNLRTTLPRKPFSSRPPPIPGAVPQALTPPPKRVASRPDVPPLRARIDTLRPNAEVGAAVPPPDPTGRVFSKPPAVLTSTVVMLDRQPGEVDDGAWDDDASPSTARMNSKAPNTLPFASTALADPPRTTPQRSAPPPLPVRASQPGVRTSQATLARPAPRPIPDIVEPTSPLPPRVRQPPVISYDDDEVESLPVSAPRRRLGGWVVAFVLLVGVGVLGAYMGRSFLEKRVHASATPPLDPRAQQYLAAGEAALLQGDLDGAKESFDKASALADKDPRVLLPTARLATIRADVPWLKQRLLAPPGVDVPPNAQAAVNANKTQLDELAAKAKKAADDAVLALPDDPAALRVKVDALRIAGDRDGARALVGRVATNASQPDTAYVLGALDLAELDPPWSVVLERLRTAAAGEAGIGRARAALAFALARSGDISQARQELDRLASLAHPPPLVPELRAFIEGAQARAMATASADAGAVASTSGASVDANKFTGGGGISGDPRTLLAQADGARQHRDFARARTLYQAALAKNANDSEALAGLGDVSHDEKDLQGAQGFYKRAIGVNPTFLPALIGLADVTWELGDRTGAQKQYKEIADRFPDGSYPPRVKQRANDASGGGTSTAAAPTTAAPATATIDTSDMPNGTPP